MADKNGLSILPDEMIESGAAPVDQDLTVKDASFVIHNYNGKAPDTCAGKLTLVNDDGKEWEQHYSVGPPDRYVPSSDGKRVQPVGTVEGITNSCNFAVLMGELISVGFPSDKLAGGDITALIGLKAHFVGVPEPDRSGLIRDPNARAVRIPAPDRLITLPGGKKATSAPKAQGSGDAVAGLIDLLPEVIESGGSMSLKKLGAAVYKNRGDSPLKDAMVEAAFSDEFKAAIMESDDFTLAGSDITRE